MRIILFFSFWILITFFTSQPAAFCQKLPSPPDSLKMAMLSAKTTESRTLVILRIAEAYVSVVDTAGYLYAKEAERIALKSGDKELEGQALNLQGQYFLELMKQGPAIAPLRKAELLLKDAPPKLRAKNFHNLGVCYEDLNQQEKAIALYHRSYNIFDQHNDMYWKAELSNALGVLHSNQARYDSAALYLFRAIKEYSLSAKPQRVANTIGNIAVFYFQQSRFEDALPYSLEALKSAENSGDSLDIAVALQNTGSIKLKLNDVSGSLKLFHRALNIYKLKKLDAYQGNIYNAIAIVHEGFQQTDSAAHYLKLGIKLSENQGQGWTSALIMGNLASLYKKAGRNKDAEYWALKSISRSKLGTDPPETLISLRVLEANATDRKDYKSAYHYLTRINQLNTRQFNKDQSLLIEELRTEYELDKAEQQVNILRQEQELAELKQQRQVAAFSGLAALFLAFGGFLFWRYKNVQHKRVSKLRTQIASDLHDDVGSLLTQISLQGSLLEEDLYSEEERKKQLSQIGQASRLAVQQMSDVVWAVDARNDGTQQLLDRMRDYAFELMSTAGIEISFDAPTELALPSENLELRQNLYYIFKEALHNTVKHSKATQVTVTFTVTNNNLLLQVQDNGRGKSQHNRISGHGLRNMEMRAEAIGGKIKFSNDTGFTVKLQVPLTRMNML